jgi:hypothetical protein
LKIPNSVSRGRGGGNGVKEKEKDEYPAIKKITNRKAVCSIAVCGGPFRKNL